MKQDNNSPQNCSRYRLNEAGQRRLLLLLEGVQRAQKTSENSALPQRFRNEASESLQYCYPKQMKAIVTDRRYKHASH